MLYERYMKKENFRVKTRNNIHKDEHKQIKVDSNINIKENKIHGKTIKGDQEDVIVIDFNVLNKITSIYISKH